MQRQLRILKCYSVVLCCLQETLSWLCRSSNGTSCCPPLCSECLQTRVKSPFSPSLSSRPSLNANKPALSHRPEDWQQTDTLPSLESDHEINFIYCTLCVVQFIHSYVHFSIVLEGKGTRRRPVFLQQVKRRVEQGSPPFTGTALFLLQTSGKKGNQQQRIHHGSGKQVEGSALEESKGHGTHLNW